MAQLINTATAAGEYDTMPFTDSTEAVVELSSISITKTADKPVWVTGPLEYTITVTNLDSRSPDDPENPGLPVTNLIITDWIETSIAGLDEATLALTIDGVAVAPDYSFNPDTGELIINIASLPATQSAVITFQVTQAA